MRSNYAKSMKILNPTVDKIYSVQNINVKNEAKSVKTNKLSKKKK